ncbi:unnamed protein product, partial [Meganyctiphanes norvegica]
MTSPSVYSLTSVTLDTMIWLLSSVYSLVRDKTMFMRKFLVTYATLIGLFSSVYSLVISKKIFPCKILLTLTSVIWLLPSVYSLMYVQRDAVSVKTLCHIDYTDIPSVQCVLSC